MREQADFAALAGAVPAASAGRRSCRLGAVAEGLVGDEVFPVALMTDHRPCAYDTAKPGLLPGVRGRVRIGWIASLRPTR
jgi:hypothetical protein